MRRWKHPHVRGEDQLLVSGAEKCLETPPRAWGRRRQWIYGQGADRNTPTCVGKTNTMPRNASGRGKHPHVRGEDRIFMNRARIRIRNTPTCVGKTNADLGEFTWLRKHPHVRGEDRGPMYACMHDAETPPRAWGRRKLGSNQQSGKGNTPTCVGKTLINCRSRCRCWKHPHVRGEDLPD